MIVSEIMSKEVVTVTPETPYRDLWKYFFSHRIHTIPVVDDRKKLLGIINREDLLRPIYPQYQEVFEYLETSKDYEAMEDKVREMAHLNAKKLMSTHVIFTREDTLIMRVLSRMIVRKVDQLPVLTYEDVVVGIITKGDIFYSLFRSRMTKKETAAKRRKPIVSSKKKSKKRR